MKEKNKFNRKSSIAHRYIRITYPFLHYISRYDCDGRYYYGMGDCSRC